MKKRGGYGQFKADDFLQDDYFLLWMDEPDQEVEAFWEEWLKDHPERSTEIEEAIERYKMLRSFDTLVAGSLKERDEVWKVIEEEMHRSPSRKLRMVVVVGSAVAAAVLLLFSIWMIRTQQPAAHDDLVLVKSDSTQKRLVLPDHSTILMDRYTTLKYDPDHFREIWIKGQAFFDLNPQRAVDDPQSGATGSVSDPFKIHTGMGSIDVLGTAFNVKNTDSTAQVILVRGKVRIRMKDNDLIMQPGERIVCKRDTVSAEFVNPQLFLAWKDGIFHFNHTSLDEVVKVIKEVYGYDLMIKNRSNLKGRTISGSVRVKDERLVWQTLAAVFDATIQRNGKLVLMTLNE